MLSLIKNFDFWMMYSNRCRGTSRLKQVTLSQTARGVSHDTHSKISKKMSMFLVMFCCVISGCQSKQSDASEKYTELKSLMWTDIRLDVCLDEVNKNRIEIIYQKVWDRLEVIAWRMNVYDDKSDVAKINSSYQNPVKVEDDTLEVIKSGLYFSKLTEGAFDITVWPLIQLWKQSAMHNQQPQKMTLQNVKKSVGLHNIKILSSGHIEVLNELTKVDLGGIAKGYAVDEAARIFREEGIENFQVDAGGDIYVGGKNCDGQAWRIGIRDPRDPAQVVDVIALTNSAVTTSGNYEKFFKIKNKKLSHIINPVTGYPQEDIVSATVIAPTAQEADALSTALCVLGEEKGLALIERLGNDRGAMMLFKKGQQELIPFISEGYKKRVLKTRL